MVETTNDLKQATKWCRNAKRVYAGVKTPSGQDIMYVRVQKTDLIALLRDMTEAGETLDDYCSPLVHVERNGDDFYYN
jgi:hypothetical protein